MRLVSWWWTAVVATALVTFAVDVTAVHGSRLPWALLYISAVVALLLWRSTHRRWLLVLFGACLFAAAAARVGSFIVQGNRWTGVANNILVMMFALDFVASHQWGRR